MEKLVRAGHGRHVALVLSVLILTGCTAAGGAEASCAAAPVSASPTLAHPGDTLEITVDYAAVASCVDNFMNGTPAPPVGEGVYRHVTVSWSQGDATKILATVDADASNRLHATVTVPATAPAGQATLGVRSADIVIVTVARR